MGGVRPILKGGSMVAAETGPTFPRGPQFVGSGKIVCMQLVKSSRKTTAEINT